MLIFEREDIERSGAHTLAELLERVAGLHVTRDSTGAETDQFVRGLNGRLLIVHNGVEITRLLSELLAMPLVDITRVEVVKGSHFPLCGPSAVAGTVNILTPGASEEALTVGIRGGSSEIAQAWTRTSGTIGDVGHSAYLSRMKTNTTEGHIDADRQSGLDEQLGTDASLAPGEGFFGSTLTEGRLTLELDDR